MGTSFARYSSPPSKMPSRAQCAPLFQRCGLTPYCRFNASCKTISSCDEGTCGQPPSKCNRRSDNLLHMRARACTEHVEPFYPPSQSSHLYVSESTFEWIITCVRQSTPKKSRKCRRFALSPHRSQRRVVVSESPHSFVYPTANIYVCRRPPSVVPKSWIVPRFGLC